MPTLISLIFSLGKLKVDVNASSGNVNKRLAICSTPGSSLPKAARNCAVSHPIFCFKD